MTTILSVENDDGCVGRCDATCYNAKNKHCTCICGGVNHGVREEHAIANAKNMEIDGDAVAKFETSRQRFAGTCRVINCVKDGRSDDEGDE